MSVHVMYYGMLAELTGKTEESWIAGEELTVGEFRAQILDKYPAIREKKFKIAVNKQISDDLKLISDLAEIALLPPFAGG
ncbi:MoaD/ThiS family protein [Dyadobacter psychrotolerans]|uniref:Molybdopterin synthase sulfur carrier subunit n=1 Tax=Dyadobacter psychrotolerans TaxID=2541721 RepID=A0A4R5DGL3_9BACT|nr:MoaD/ThiS family protein [Dyadobacter psychrotolerans]TDE13162.1 MoaD/ThiS family protein [Dyadobacter psychrotolerans]